MIILCQKYFKKLELKIYKVMFAMFDFDYFGFNY